MKKRFLGWAVTISIVTGAVATPSGASDPLQVEVLSTPAHLVTGGDALIGIDATDSTAISVAADHPAVTTLLEEDGDRILGRVSGLPIGWTTLHIEEDATGRAATLKLKNHPIEGPVFSGPHQTPFVCETSESGLGPPLDANCSAESLTEFRYRSGSTWETLDDPANPPQGVANTTTIDGHRVPFIVRIESGTINRAIYRIAILDDGTYDSDGHPAPGWNGKLVYTYGGGCDAGYHQGVNSIDDVLLPAFLQRGYAVATASLNVGVTNCNDVLSAETTMMVKEHFIERYDVPRYTIGQGGSGGAIQIHLIAENYPGLLDGLLPNSAFPDALSIGSGIADCRLLNTYFDASVVPWTEVQRSAVTGFHPFPVPVCESIDKAFGDQIVPDKSCRIPAALVYHPVERRDGARCTYQDHLVTIFGIDPATGFARRALDNVGVQYGLAALQAGTITIEQFLDLNESVGGYDIDARLIAERTAADPAAVQAGYESGRIVTGAGGLADIPVITIAGYKDNQGNPHDRVRNFSLRERLEREVGDADNYVLWTTMGVPGTGGFGVPMLTMDAWLEAILADPDQTSDAHDRVVRNRPADARDACWLGDRFDEPATYDDPSACNAVYRSHGDPRIAAGAPVTNDVVKCALRPLGAAEYGLLQTPLHLERLQSIFPDGVCNYTVPGVGQVPPSGTWQSWGAES